ncbi:uncharacterized protein LOC144100725 isoform X2 [Amblyomma americanum]
MASTSIFGRRYCGKVAACWTISMYLESGKLMELRSRQNACPNKASIPTKFSSKWHKERKFRISSTTAHTILHARRSPDVVAKAILDSRPFSSQATAYDGSDPTPRSALVMWQP